jgi:lysyl-tRNA synthetase, class II
MTHENDEHYDLRIKNVQSKEANGITTYPNHFQTDCNLHEFAFKYNYLQNNESNEIIVKVAGRIQSIRKCGKKLYFVDITSNGNTLQLFAHLKIYKSSKTFFEDFEDLYRGDIIGVTGNPHRAKAGELSIQVHEMQILTPCLRAIPSVKNDLVNKELRYRKRYLDLICNQSQMEIYEIRSDIISFLRKFLSKDDFIEVETPMMNVIHGGANAKPFVTHHNDLGLNLFMRIAPELYLKRLIVGGYERVFEIGKQFRNEHIDLTHNPEFTTCEFYWAYKNYQDLMTYTEKFFDELIKNTGESYRKLGYTNKNGKKIKIDFNIPFKRIDIITELESKFGKAIPKPYDSLETQKFLFERCIEYDLKCGHPITTAKLFDKLIEHFIESQCDSPTFIMNHPTIMSPLAKTHPDNPELTERFELFIAGFELCNSYTELNDPRIQRARFESQIKNKDAGDTEAQPLDEDYCEALEYGLPPTAGWGLGIDRLTMIFTNTTNIKEVILFPTMKPSNLKPD